MTPLETAQYMLNQDFFSQWMEIKLVEVREHYFLIEMPIKKEMINGLKTVHGGVTFAFADSALAFSLLFTTKKPFPSIATSIPIPL